MLRIFDIYVYNHNSYEMFNLFDFPDIRKTFRFHFKMFIQYFLLLQLDNIRLIFTYFLLHIDSINFIMIHYSSYIKYDTPLFVQLFSFFFFFYFSYSHEIYELPCDLKHKQKYVLYGIKLLQSKESRMTRHVRMESSS